MATTNTQSTKAVQGGERVKDASLFIRTLRRPEAGAVAGTIVIWVYFAFVAGN